MRGDSKRLRCAEEIENQYTTLHRGLNYFVHRFRGIQFHSDVQPDSANFPHVGASSHDRFNGLTDLLNDSSLLIAAKRWLLPKQHKERGGHRTS